MKHRTKFAVLTVAISLAGLGVMVSQNWKNERTIVVTLPAARYAEPIVVLTPTTQPAAAVAATPIETAPTVTEAPATLHTVQPGETLGSLASGLRNKDAKAYRDAIVAANPSLQADPDKLIAGKTYVLPNPTDVTASEPAAALPAEVSPTATPIANAPAAPADLTKQMKYTAAPGDTVTSMAGAFLGGADKANQEAITDANPSLKADPDKVVVGKAYKIPVTEGLTAAAVEKKTESRDTVQPDADSMVTPAAPKTLQYVARSGDTLTSMAIALLGSDTPAARSAIISYNPSLKANPDKVIAGHTYSIPAPVAELDPR